MASHFHLSCQADPRPAVLLVGHSFVSRLEGALFFPNHPYCRPNFELKLCKVEFFGEGGWTVGDKPERLEHMQSKLRPVFRAMDTPIINFWRHKRVTESPMAIFDRNGCHLNVIGMKKYYKFMRQAIILAVEDVRNVCSS